MAFVRARHPEATPANAFKNLKKPSTALKDATDGVKNLVSAAYNVRHVKSRLLAVQEGEGAECKDPSRSNPSGRRWVALRSRVVLNPGYNDIMPSAILNDSAKVDIIRPLFDPQAKLNKICYNHPHTLAAYQSTVVADQLFSILKDRLHAHIDRRVKHSQKLHW